MRLRERAPQATPDVAPEIVAFPELLQYATAPVEVQCRQGCHSYVARQVALREGRMLFVDPATSQFGIARLEGSAGVDAHQYPAPRIAVVMFLGPREALDAE